MRRFEKFFPPGYGYGSELGVGALLWGGALCVNILWFGLTLYAAVEKLYVDTDFGRALREGARVEAFAELTGWFWAFWAPALLFLALQPLCHYFYYLGTGSMYVMRRLPRRGVVFKSCVSGPALGACIVLASAAVLYLLYFGIYCLGVPAECVPHF